MFAVPGDLATPTGGYAYDRRMIAELRDLGWQADVLGLGDGFPRPSEATRMAALTKLLEIPAGRPIVDRWPGAWRPAGGRGAACAVAIRCWRWCIIRSRWRQDCLQSRPTRCAAVSEPRLQRCKASSSQVPRRARSSLPNTACRPSASPSQNRAAIASPLAAGSRDGVVRLLSVGAVVRARVLTC